MPPAPRVVTVLWKPRPRPLQSTYARFTGVIADPLHWRKRKLLAGGQSER